jgi:hypothetical protein
MVNPFEVIDPYDVAIESHLAQVNAKWIETIPRLLGAGNEDRLLVFYSGGCPREHYTDLMRPILRPLRISLITFGRPNMYDIGRLDDFVTLVAAGTSLHALREILRVPERLAFYRC